MYIWKNKLLITPVLR